MTDQVKLEKYASRSYAGLVVRTFFYCIIPTFFIYMTQVSNGMSKELAFARGFIGSSLIILGILIIKKKLAIKKIAKIKNQLS